MSNDQRVETKILHFSGTIPDFSKNVNLQTLVLASNNLEGEFRILITSYQIRN